MPISQNISERTVPTSSDQDQLAAHEGAELEVDQPPGLARLLPPAPRQQGEHDLLGTLPLEDPVGGAREQEEETDDHLDRLAGQLDPRIEKLGRRGEVVEPPLEADQEVALETARMARLLRGSESGPPAARRGRSGPRRERGARRTRAARRRRRAARGSGSAIPRARGTPRRRRASTPGRIADAITIAPKKRKIASRIFQSASVNASSDRARIDAISVRRATTAGVRLAARLATAHLLLEPSSVPPTPPYPHRLFRGHEHARNLLVRRDPASRREHRAMSRSRP